MFAVVIVNFSVCSFLGWTNMYKIKYNNVLNVNINCFINFYKKDLENPTQVHVCVVYTFKVASPQHKEASHTNVLLTVREICFKISV